MNEKLFQLTAKSFQGGSGSPLEARQTAPTYLIILLLIIFILVLSLIFFLYKAFSTYLKSEKYIEKQKNRKTKKSDVEKICKKNHFTSEDEEILWEVCRLTECNNITYLLRTNADVVDLFRQAFNIAKEKDCFTEHQINDFFVVLYKLEKLVAQKKIISSTRQMTEGSKITHIADDGEQTPFTINKINKDYLIAGIPPYFYNSEKKPKPLSKQRFTYKSPDELTYNLVARIVRYEETAEKNHQLYITHTEQLLCQAQRHYKREFLNIDCTFSPLIVNKSASSDEEKYIFSDKIYNGMMSNISGGGCCIQTKLPIKEGQNISVSIPEFGIQERIIGIIKSTRKLPNEKFALHIQFLQISIESRNKIYLAIYKF